MMACENKHSLRSSANSYVFILAASRIRSISAYLSMSLFPFQFLKNYYATNKLYFVVVIFEPVPLSSELSLYDKRLQNLGFQLSVHLRNLLFKDPLYSFDLA